MRKGSSGCLDALAVDTMIGQDAKAKERNLAVCWIDFQKAYDLVPHELIRDSLRAIRAPQWIQDLISRTIPKWSTNIVLKSREGSTIALPIKFRRGLFQGDALSPLLFYLCLAPLSKAINEETDGYLNQYLPGVVTHMAYMDDVKLYGTNKKAVCRAVNTVERVAEETEMRLGRKGK